MRKISTALSTLLITLFSASVFATGPYVTTPVNNQSAQAIAGMAPSGAVDRVKTDGDGNLEFTGSVALPTGASTAINQTNGNQKTQIVDGSGNVIGSTANALWEDVVSSVLPTGAATAANQTNGTQLTGLVQAAAFSESQSASLETSHVIKGSAGRLYKVTGRIDATAATGTYYIQLINAASVPADGAVTLLAAPFKIQVTTGTDYYFNFDFTGNDSVSGIAASTGIVIDVSTTEFTKTLVGSNILSQTSFYQ